MKDISCDNDGGSVVGHDENNCSNNIVDDKIVTYTNPDFQYLSRDDDLFSNGASITNVNTNDIVVVKSLGVIPSLQVLLFSPKKANNLLTTIIIITFLLFILLLNYFRNVRNKNEIERRKRRRLKEEQKRRWIRGGVYVPPTAKTMTATTVTATNKNEMLDGNTTTTATTTTSPSIVNSSVTNTFFRSPMTNEKGSNSINKVSTKKVILEQGRIEGMSSKNIISSSTLNNQNNVLSIIPITPIVSSTSTSSITNSNNTPIYNVESNNSNINDTTTFFPCTPVRSTLRKKKNKKDGTNHNNNTTTTSEKRVTFGVEMNNDDSINENNNEQRQQQQEHQFLERRFYYDKTQSPSEGIKRDSTIFNHSGASFLSPSACTQVNIVANNIHNKNNNYNNDDEDIDKENQIKLNSGNEDQSHHKRSSINGVTSVMMDMKNTINVTDTTTTTTRIKIKPNIARDSKLKETKNTSSSTSSHALSSPYSPRTLDDRSSKSSTSVVIAPVVSTSILTSTIEERAGGKSKGKNKRRISKEIEDHEGRQKQKLRRRLMEGPILPLSVRVGRKRRLPLLTNGETRNIHINNEKDTKEQGRNGSVNENNSSRRGRVELPRSCSSPFQDSSSLSWKRRRRWSSSSSNTDAEERVWKDVNTIPNNKLNNNNDNNVSKTYSSSSILSSKGEEAKVVTEFGATPKVVDDKIDVGNVKTKSTPSFSFGSDNCSNIVKNSSISSKGEVHPIHSIVNPVEDGEAKQTFSFGSNPVSTIGEEGASKPAKSFGATDGEKQGTYNSTIAATLIPVDNKVVNTTANAAFSFGKSSTSASVNSSTSAPSPKVLNVGANVQSTTKSAFSLGARDSVIDVSAPTVKATTAKNPIAEFSFRTSGIGNDISAPTPTVQPSFSFGVTPIQEVASGNPNNPSFSFGNAPSVTTTPAPTVPFSFNTTATPSITSAIPVAPTGAQFGNISTPVPPISFGEPPKGISSISTPLTVGNAGVTSAFSFGSGNTSGSTRRRVKRGGRRR